MRIILLSLTYRAYPLQEGEKVVILKSWKDMKKEREKKLYHIIKEQKRKKRRKKV